ncbi:DnaA N-terminal domain-containing protein [Cereibacter sphaeroides]|uniref:DnaA N-terminal domain-containing protein n=1 Tax=Cereibacter sphaeroides TaxID=1063 RepID=UPI003FCDBAA3
MQNARLAGPGAGAEKYDILTALAVKGLSSSGPLQTSILRLVALVTARYNWARGEMAIGQREMAALWSVDERTAKRETRRLIDTGFLVLKVRGVKGRVAVYALDLPAIYGATQEEWGKVGSDFALRMAGRHEPAPQRQVPPQAADAHVVHVDFSGGSRGASSPWSRMMRMLEDANPAHFASWYARLSLVRAERGVVTVCAPSRFAAQYLETHLRREIEHPLRVCFGPDTRCEIVAAS